MRPSLRRTILVECPAMFVRIGVIHALVFALLVITSTGCANGITGGKTYAKFRPDDTGHIEPARSSGEHFIVVRMAGTGGLARLPHMTRELKKGDRVGFTRDERANLLAVAGNATASLEPVPVGVTYLAWYYRKDQPLFEVTRSVRDGAGRVLGAAVQAGAVLGAVAIEGALDGDDEDEDDKEPEWLRRQRKRGR
jgi:hypothetical protein